jgi:hypothetical protein
MKVDGDEPRHESRLNVDELAPDVRRRLLALDEPVARDDWQDVVKRSRSATLRTRQLGLLTAVSLTVAAVGLAVGLWAWSTTRVADVGGALTPVLNAGGHVLYVSPTRQGGFCYEWRGVGSGCNPLRSTPLHVTWGNDRVVGTVAYSRISSVRIRFTDGTSAAAAISWVSAPIKAGFFVYRIPAGKTVAEVNGYEAGRILRQVTWFSV